MKIQNPTGLPVEQVRSGQSVLMPGYMSGFGNGFDLKSRLPAGADDAEDFAVCRREILSRDSGCSAGA